MKKKESLSFSLSQKTSNTSALSCLNFPVITLFNTSYMHPSTARSCSVSKAKLILLDGYFILFVRCDLKRRASQLYRNVVAENKPMSVPVCFVSILSGASDDTGAASKPNRSRQMPDMDGSQAKGAVIRQQDGLEKVGHNQNVWIA